MPPGGDKSAPAAAAGTRRWRRYFCNRRQYVTAVKTEPVGWDRANGTSDLVTRLIFSRLMEFARNHVQSAKLKVMSLADR